MTAPNPVAFSFFGIDVRWYGVLIAIGFIMAIYISYLRAPKMDIRQEYILDLAIAVIPAAVIGARLYYVIFKWSYYSNNLGEIINIRNGGLAIHGGMILGILAGVCICRWRHIAVLNLADLIFPQVALAQAIGRWGNFFNSEAHGGPTDIPWAVLIDGQKYQPTFLYESLFCFILFMFLIAVSHKRAFVGQIGLMYGMLYSIERYFVEGMRTDSLMIGNFRTAQIVSIITIVLCLAAYVYLANRKPKKNNRKRK